MEYAVTDPRTGVTVEEFATASDAEVAQAVTDADQAHPGWRATDPAQRAAVVRRVGELHRERAAELAALAEQEMGKPAAEGVGEVEFSAAIYQYYADQAESLLADEPIELASGPGTAVIRVAPIGTVLGIMPWNYPYYQVARFLAPNLVMGNTALLKPAPQCPRSSAAIAAILREAGVPEGVVVTLYADTDQVATVIAAPTVRGVSLTGSGRAGAAVAELAGRHLKKVVLELGGSDPFLVLDGATLQETVEAAVAARLENTGQACNAAKRFIVVDEVYEDFLAAFTPLLLDSWSGAPLSSQTAADTLQDQVDRAVAQGAHLETRGAREGCFVPAGVLTGVEAHHDVYREELFGPVAVVHRVADEDAAVALANDTPYGLGSYVYTGDPVQAQRVADGLDAGMVFINGVGAEGAELPFGGTKASGTGRELGRLGAYEFVNRKLVRTVG